MLPLGHHLVDHGKERIDVEWLRQIIARAGGEQAFDLARGGIRAQNDDRNFGRARFFLKLSQNFRAMDVRQIEIEQDQFRT